MVKQKGAAPKSTPISASSGSSQDPLVSKARAEFVSAALSMSWQLAVAVLVPVILGYKLDQHFNVEPLWTVIGFIVAIIGVFLLIRKTLKEFDPGVKK